MTPLVAVVVTGDAALGQGQLSSHERCDFAPAPAGEDPVTALCRVGPQPGRGVWPWCGEGASRPRARARATVSVRRCVPSLAYRWRMWVRTVLIETYSSPAISGPDRLVGR